MWNWLNGKKSYIVAAVGILYAVVEYWQGAINQQALVAAILAALGVSAVRSGMASEAVKTRTLMLNQGAVNMGAAPVAGAGTLTTKAVLLAAVLGGMAFMTGCQNQAAQLQPQLAAADAATNSGRILFTAVPPMLTVTQARTLSKDLHVADAGFVAAMSSIKLNQPPAAVIVNQILSSLTQIAVDLQANPATKAKGDAMRAAVAQARATTAAQTGAKKLVTPGEVIALIDLVVGLTPGIINELDILFGGSNITPADCQAELTKFETDLAVFDGMLAATTSPAN